MPVSKYKAEKVLGKLYSATFIVMFGHLFMSYEKCILKNEGGHLGVQVASDNKFQPAVLHKAASFYSHWLTLGLYKRMMLLFSIVSSAV